MCEGEVLQICFRGDPNITIDAYRTICEYKTAYLTQCCTRTGALLGGDGAYQMEGLAQFGHAMGMAFQIVDDILDTIGDERTLGKPIGGDLREAKVTLPTIYALQRAGEKDRKALQELLLVSQRLTAQEIAVIRNLIERYDGFGSARQMAQDYIVSAKDALASLPSSVYRNALAALADRLVDRDR
jgi:geranylgeranyl pyrophosphate synthase